jgi:hypothetical protein
MKKLIFLSLLFVLPTMAFSQTSSNEDAMAIRQIYDKALTQGQSYTWLRHLTKNIGNRISGSPSAAKAVEWTKTMMDTLGADKVWLQPCTVPHGYEAQKKKLISLNQNL